MGAFYLPICLMYEHLYSPDFKTYTHFELDGTSPCM